MPLNKETDTILDMTVMPLNKETDTILDMTVIKKKKKTFKKYLYK